jgi:glycosyltransferase involved in cell wall biosynthesis
MNILFLAAQFYPSRGGVQTHVLKLSRELVKMGHNVTVVTEGGEPDASDASNGSMVRRTDYDGIHIIYCNFGPRGFAKKFRIWSMMWSLRAEFMKSDIVHCHDVFFWYLPLRLIYPKIHVFTTFHGYEMVFPPRRKAILIRRLSNKLSRGSIHIGSYIQKWYGTQADVTLYGGVDLVDAPKPSPSRMVRIAMVGRLDKDIGCLTSGEVLKLLKRRGTPFRLDVYGEGSMSGLLEEYGKVHGMVENVQEQLRDVDIVFASSYLSILDALAYWKPVCAVYENPLKRDYLTCAPFAPWLCISDKPGEIVDYIVKIGQAKFELPRQAELKTYLTRNTWKNVAEAYIKLWEK